MIEPRLELAAPVPTHWERYDPTFAKVDGDEWMERIFTAGRWLEGPTYVPAWRSLVFSDIPNDRVLRWDETTGRVGIFRAPAGFANGHTLDRTGRLITCEQGNRRVVRTEADGALTVLAERHDGKRLNSPNDVVEHSDGSVWFTDPSYGIDSDYEGVRADAEIDGCHVYRIDPSGAVEVVADDFVRPNGLAFSADESHLYVADTRERHLRVFDVGRSGRLSGGGVLAECTAGSFDGLRLDTEGRIWAATHDGVHVFHPGGELLGKLCVPEVVSNVCFGGPRRNHLFVTATSALYTLRLNVNGVR
ncbi:SMP-30/gluconolactonase/LRE family protein [Nocardioides sp. YIM 152315]|uniref:SMP-30/gluconolactonase/LRE family protein n=1 Tax=Nocardioides sp. YIM 152315 TaxID=3031760 RepID=UPI0023DB35CC|nr:SMP-30/gluconolactonase/LRE family protein [Nocardioides sp. YIM 152315]MDF1602304.1 SMP-30/gluconolactonase/LRE family protein [Nocardioides sp. YIM 152315]